MPENQYDKAISPNEDQFVYFAADVEGVEDALRQDLSIQEINMTESLLTPGLQTSVTIQDVINHSPRRKVLDNYSNKALFLKIERPILKNYGQTSVMDIKQTIYRLDNRVPQSYQLQNYNLNACDPTMLKDANMLVSKSWSCTSPSTVVRDVLKNCVGAKNLVIEDSAPKRDYIAENIHPFQVVSQQADVALAGGNDPSFVHYMTYEKSGEDGSGTHKFQSLTEMVKQEIIAEFTYNEKGPNDAGYFDPYNIMSYSFPCDFDILSDILNGVGVEGSKRTMIPFNPANGLFSVLGDKSSGCGIGGAAALAATTNYGTAGQQDSCNVAVEKYGLLRQARMGLLEEDKLGLRIIVPWNPILHAGKMIKVNFINKGDEHGKPTDGDLNYGSGDYLIASMTHTIKAGGFGITSLDCVSKTVGFGKV
jgi:hypothetical protein